LFSRVICRAHHGRVLSLPGDAAYSAVRAV
jgi:hypothetical protein